MKNLFLTISAANAHLFKNLKINDALNFCLEDIGIGHGFDRCFIVRNVLTDGTSTLFWTNEWCQNGKLFYKNKPDLSRIFYQDLPDLYYL